VLDDCDEAVLQAEILEEDCKDEPNESEDDQSGSKSWAQITFEEETETKPPASNCSTRISTPSPRQSTSPSPFGESSTFSSNKSPPPPPLEPPSFVPEELKRYSIPAPPREPAPVAFFDAAPAEAELIPESGIPEGYAPVAVPISSMVSTAPIASLCPEQSPGLYPGQWNGESQYPAQWNEDCGVGMGQYASLTVPHGTMVSTSPCAPTQCHQQWVEPATMPEQSCGSLGHYPSQWASEPMEHMTMMSTSAPTQWTNGGMEQYAANDWSETKVYTNDDPVAAANGWLRNTCEDGNVATEGSYWVEYSSSVNHFPGNPPEGYSNSYHMAC
jgi:hypothetical protein